jgi:hypothetical protein
MGETEATSRHWTAELERLLTLRDNIDQRPKELRNLLREQRRDILKQRQAIIRSLVEKVDIYADGRVRVEGVFDGQEGELLRKPVQEQNNQTDQQHNPALAHPPGRTLMA